MIAGVPFGALNAEWREMRNRMRPDEQLWRFTREPKLPFQGALEGYVVLRGCEIVDRLVMVSD
jgi:hypothetical protein